jgi:hypothetical protein
VARRKNSEAGNEPGGVENERGDAARTTTLGTENPETVDPFELTTPAEPEPRARKPRNDTGIKRGRPRRGAAEAESAQNLAGILLSLHAMGAVLLKTPELELTEEESAKLAAAIAHVNELYGGVVLPEKATAWINLIMVAGTIYGPRIIVIGAKKKIHEVRETLADQQPTPVIFAGPIVAHQA